MNDTFLSSGPNGEFTMTMVQKQPSVSAVYTFENKWEVYDKDGKIDEIIGADPIYKTNVNKDIFLKPIFTEKVRQYTINFYTYNLVTDKVDSLIESKTVDYGTLLSTIFSFNESILC